MMNIEIFPTSFILQNSLLQEPLRSSNAILTDKPTLTIENNAQFRP
jgi:hypothetical protein